MTRPFHRSLFQRLGSDSFPYTSTRLDWSAVAEYTSARATKSALLTGRPRAAIGAARSAGSSFVCVADGATPLIVISSFIMTDRRARMIPTSYACTHKSIYALGQFIVGTNYVYVEMSVPRTASLPPEYTGRDCSGAYAVALVVMTMLPAIRLFRMRLQPSLTVFRTARTLVSSTA